MVGYILIIIKMNLFSLISEVKNSRMIQSAVLLFVSTFIMFNTDNNDYETYEEGFYYDDPKGLFEIGFKCLIKIVKLLGINNYRIILIILAIFFAFTFIRWEKYIDNIVLVLTLFFVFPFVYFIIQIRNSFMMLLFLNALYEYCEGKKIRAIFLAGLSCTFHIFGIVLIVQLVLCHFLEMKRKRSDYSLYLLNYRKNSFFYNIAIFCSLISFGTICFFGDRIISSLMIFFPIIGKIHSYLKGDIDYESIIMWGGICLFDVIIYYYTCLKTLKRSKDQLNDKRIKILWIFMVTSCIQIPILGFISEYNRIFRTTFLIKYMLLGCLGKRISLRKRFFLFTYNFVTAFACLGVIFYRGIELDKILFSNILWNFLKG